MKRVLITGASGFIGSYLKEHLTGFEISTLSLRDPNWKKQPIDADVVIHCAGLAHSKKSLPRERYMDVNCNLTMELLELSLQHNVSHFIFLSTMLVYGEGNIGAIGRDSKINPISDYAKSKLCAEEFVSDKKNIKSTVLRLPLVYGDKVKGNLASLGRLASISPLFLNIHNSRSILMIEDLVKTIHEVILHQTTGIILPTSRIVSTSDMYGLLRSPKRYYLVPIPKILENYFKEFSGFLGKLFGDAYYLKVEVENENPSN
jgi:UDP-glucose 4-epimerase